MAISSSACSDEGTNGFSTMTCFPACSADLVNVKCVSGVVVMTIMSMEGSAKSVVAEEWIFAVGWSEDAESLGLGVR